MDQTTTKKTVATFCYQCVAGPDLMRVEVEDGIATLTLNNGKVNALSENMLEQLLAAIAKAAEADAALLISGRPGIFSGGYDRKLIDAGGPACDAMRAAGDRLTLALLDYPAPLVIAATGHAMAKAAFMLLLADYRLGTEGDYRVSLFSEKYCGY